MSQLKQTICLNMIVRNEARVIERCLNSVKKFIDYWVIVDTGSTDGSQQLIRQSLRNVPGELIERPWVDFAHNRSEALEFTRGKSDYVFVIDADELLVVDDGFTFPQLTHDAYYLKISSNPITFWRAQLIRNMPGWRYESAIHEYLSGPVTAVYERLHGLWIDSRNDGWRAAQPGVYQKDAEQLLRAHKEAPNDSRILFHLGQSYVAAGNPESALEYYQQCAAISFWPEEKWIALFQIAEIKQRLQREWPEVLAAYLDAYQYRPTRAEPLYKIAFHYRWAMSYHLAHMFLQQAVTIPYPQDDVLYVEERLYRYVIKMALATCCYQLGQYEAGLRYCDELLQDPRSMPQNIYEQILINRQECAKKVAEVYAQSEASQPTIKVFIPFSNSGHQLDNCVERLLDQTCVPFEMVFIDLGAADGSDQKIPVEDSRVTLVRRSETENFWSFVARHSDANDVVLLLDRGGWLVSSDSLAQLQQCFADPSCLVTYGQFQYCDGSSGIASPIGNIDSEDLLIEDWRCTYPLAFRGSLLHQIVREDPELADSHPALARKLFAAAGTGGVRFNPMPICVYDTDRTPRNGAHAAAVSKQTKPKISCLTVTLNRLVLLKEAIQCYCRQTYSNRELIIVTDGTPRYQQAISDYLRWLGRDDIRLIPVEKQTLGALRNGSLDAATGDIVCQWDDDDLNHPQRLERQFEHLSAAKAHACCFTDQLQFFFAERSLFWSDWCNCDTEGVEQLIPGTMMTHRDARFRYPETTEVASAGEDSVLLQQIAKNASVAPFQDAGFLNIYSYHGKNVFSEVHHRRITFLAGRSVDSLRIRESVLRDALRHYRLPEPYRVIARDGKVMFVQN
jgi:glycosyltransferase involved in cell wall biosynthesis